MIVIKKGNVPKTPHTEFYAIPDVLSLEEIHGTYGFSGPHTRKIHVRSYPTEYSKEPTNENFDLLLKQATGDILQPYHIVSFDMPFEGNPVSGRRPLLFGLTTIISVCKPVESMSDKNFFRNGEKHEIYYVQEGEGVFSTEYGNLVFRAGLYLIIPKGTTYNIKLKSKNAFFLIMESSYPITFPPHYMNSAGQATLMAPVVETEIELVEFQPPKDEQGEFLIIVKHSGGYLTKLTLGHHPFDLSGWEGAVYPFGFDIKNHHGIAREIHTAPPMHQTFQSGHVPFNGFSICSFVSQMEGWNLKDIPAPFAHSNVDSDEVMFFSSAEYGAREGVIKPGAITFHPGSIPHSPHGNAALASIKGRGKMNNRLAVMLDTYFESLKVTEYAYKYRDKNYAVSWHKMREKIN